MRTWEDKEAAYWHAYGSQRTARDIWKYIPDRIRSGVSAAFADSDGYWIYLEPGWTAYDGAEDCGVIRTFTIADLRADIKTIRRKGVNG